MIDASQKAVWVGLVGLPGSGKSSVGAQLARRLGCTFVDTDSLIEQRIGCSIREYFAREGEAAFRDVEQSVIEEVARGPDAVVATGGGAVLREANRKCLRERGFVVYLRATPEELYRRLRRDAQRPLLQVDDPLAKLRELHAQREPLYRAAAHAEVPSGRSSVSRVTHLVLEQLRMRPAGPQGAPPYAP